MTPSLPYQRVLVTGGAGFIGSHIVDCLLENQLDVTVVDNLDSYYDPRLKRQNLDVHNGEPRFRLSRADITDLNALTTAFCEARPQLVIHLAARVGVRPSTTDPKGYVDTNVIGTANVLEAARKAGVEKIIFGSSSSVYGDNEKVPFAESDPLLRPASPYAATKIAGEALCESFSRCYRLPTVALRFFTVYGPRQRPDLAIHKFARLMLHNQPLPVFGDGGSQRDYTYVNDIVDGVCRAIRYDAFPDPDVPWRVFNLGSDHPIGLHEMVASLANVLGCEPVIERLPEQTGDVRRTWADLTRSQRELGYLPNVSFEEGLRRFASWLTASTRAPAT